MEAVVLLVKHLQEAGKNFRVITPYDAQRSLVENALKTSEHGLQWENTVFNVDAFQGECYQHLLNHLLDTYQIGNEEDIIIISVVRSRQLGFLQSLRRTNVMLTRCKAGMYICSSKAFLAGRGGDSLVGKMASHFGDEAWISWEELEAGKI